MEWKESACLQLVKTEEWNLMTMMLTCSKYGTKRRRSTPIEVAAAVFTFFLRSTDGRTYPGWFIGGRLSVATASTMCVSEAIKIEGL